MWRVNHHVKKGFGIMIDGNDEENRKRQVWIALLGALFILLFLLFGLFQGSLFQGFNAVAQGSAFQGSSSQEGSAIVVSQNGGSASTRTVPPPIIAQVPPAATKTAQVVPTVTPHKEGALTASLSGGRNAVQTTRSYAGPVTITVSGTGQAAGKYFSDAFYIYADGNGKSVSPIHDSTLHGLCIDGQPVDHFVQAIPVYNARHRYTFTFMAPGGILTFGVCDDNYADNTGSFTIMFM